MALCAWSTGLVFAIAVLVHGARSARKPRRLSSHGKSVRWFGLSLPTHLFRQRLRRCLSLFHLNFLPHPLLSQSCGVIGHAVPSGVGGSSCFVHKPSCFLLLRCNGRRNTRANRQRDTPELNVRIGVSRGMSVSPVTLAHPMPRRLPSLFMAFLPPLRTSLARHSWLLRNRLPACSFWRRSCSPACKGEGPSAASHLAVVSDKQCGISACHFVSETV
jgi:hypothetical protein